jgi:hypothetical protein
VTVGGSAMTRRPRLVARTALSHHHAALTAQCKARKMSRQI